MSRVAYPHIEIGADGMPRIAGTTTKVVEVVLERVAYHWDADQIHRQHPHLSLGAIHAALAYYYDHRDEIDAALASQRDEFDRLRSAADQSDLSAKLRRS